jgi:hypothetical protein
MRMPFFNALLAAAVVAAVPAAAIGAQETASDQHSNADYVAHLVALNGKVTGRQAVGEARFRIRGDSLTVSIRMRDVPGDVMHLQHFHGFADGHQSTCPTRVADKNGDGIIDLIETEPAVGTTMVPFHDDPVSMEIVKDTYPKASGSGSYRYKKTVSLRALQEAFGAKFGGQQLALDRRVVMIHGVPSATQLPTSVASLGDIPAQVTLPIACGAIKRVK